MSCFVNPSFQVLLALLSANLVAQPIHAKKEATGLSQAQQAAHNVRPNGANLYGQSCASCHGTHGQGADISVVGFETPLPDFTDCSFATREPDADWAAVISEGGPVRAFDSMMPAFGDALSREEIHAILSHIRTWCDSRTWPRGDLNLPRALFTEKAFPEDEAVFDTKIATEGDHAVHNRIVYEKRLGSKYQFECVIPFSFAEMQSAAPDQNNHWQGGIGDVAFGLKRVLIHSVKTGSILSMTGEMVLPTGNKKYGFGKNTPVFEPFVSFGQLLPWDSFVQAQAGLELPADTERAEQEAFWRGALGTTFTQGEFGRTWSPMAEVLGARGLKGNSETDWDVVPQMQVSLPTRQHILASVGVKIPINNREARFTQVLAYLLWDWFDGGLAEGW